MEDLDLSDFILQDIKYNPITRSQIESIYAINSSYEALFSKRAQKYKSMNLKDNKLKEEDFKELILQEYTFLKRPVFVLDKDIFVGNSKENIRALKDILS
jgi:arsenate reductase